MSLRLERYYVEPAVAFARGTFADLAALDDAAAFGEALARGLRLHRFKRNADLPRVRRVLSLLAALDPASLLDIGSGRGTFLWPLLNERPDLQVTAVDTDEVRARDLERVARGGIARLSTARQDAAQLSFPDDAFDGATLLEVLEHVPDPAAVAAEVVRVARRFVIASVPSRPDNNPEHVRLFTRDTLTALLHGAGARSVRLEYVLNHAVALALL